MGDKSPKNKKKQLRRIAERKASVSKTPQPEAGQKPE